MNPQTIFYHRVHNLTLAIFGIFLNLLLIFVVLKRTKKNFRLYARLVLFCAIYDIAYSCLEILCQHQLEIKNGYFFIMAYGIEKQLPHTAVNILGVIHLSCFLACVTIVPTQFRYRYWMVSRAAPSIWRLAGSIGLSFFASTLLAVLALFAHFECNKRGDEFYIKMLGPEWRDSNGQSHFINAIDFDDTITKIYYFLGTNIITGSYLIALYYGYKSVKVVQPVPDTDAKGKSVALRKMFARNLIVQAVNAYFCSVMPTSWVAFSVIFKLDMSGYGVWVYSIMAWIPTLNAGLTLAIIKPYRDFFYELCGVSDKQQANTQPTQSAVTSTRAESEPE